MTRSNMKQIFGTQKLKGGAEVYINPTKGKCKKCGKDMYWALTDGRKATPVRWTKEDGWFSHFADCKFAKDFRKK